MHNAVVGITGGGGHLGRAIALDLAGAGATVAISGRSLDPLESVRAEALGMALPGKVVPVVADSSTDSGIKMVLDTLLGEGGHVNGWVNAAYGGVTGPLMTSSRADVEQTVLRGLADVIIATQKVAERMIDGGSIVNFGSMYGLVAPDPLLYVTHPDKHNPPGYGAAKAGVIQFTRYAACELGPRKIRVNCVSPGPFPNPSNDPDFINLLDQRVPLQRVGEPREIVGAVRFLLCEASSYVTGHNLVVDGGWTSL